MQSSDASKFLLYFDSQRSKSSEKIHENELLDVFTPALWGNNIVPRSSIHGRISQWIYRHRSKSPVLDQIKSIFKTALDALYLDEKAASTVPMQLRLQLSVLLGSNLPFDPLKILSLPSLQEIEPVQHAPTEPVMENDEDIKKHSLLRKPSPYLVENLDLPTFQSLLNPEGTFSAGMFEYLEKFLASNPTYTHHSYQMRLNAFKEGLFSKSSREKILASAKSTSADEFAAEAKKLVSQVHSISNQECFFYCGQIGKTYSPSEWIQEIGKKVPSSVLDQLPPFLQQIIQQKDLPDPKIYVEQLIQSFLTSALQLFPDTESAALKEAIKLLMQEDSRKLPPQLQKIIPDIIGKPIESWLQQGLIGNAMEFVHDGTLRERLLQFSERSDLLKDVANNKELIGALVQMVVDPYLEELKSKKDSVNTHLSDIIAKAHSAIPPLGQQILGIDGLSNPVPMWLEIKKQADGKFSVSIFTDGPSLHYHTSPTGSIEWPLHFQDIEASQLNEDFFQRLISFGYILNSESNFHALLEDFYHSTITYLKGNRVTAKGQTFHQHNVSNPFEWNMVLGLLVKDTADLNFLHYQLHSRAFNDFCRPYLKGSEKQLDLTDTPQISFILESAINQLINEAKLNPNHVKEEDLKKLEATKKEILQSRAPKQEPAPSAKEPKKIATAEKKSAKTQNNPKKTSKKVKISLPPEIYQKLGPILDGIGISPQQLASSRDLIAWALGDEVGELIDALNFELPSPVAKSAAADSKPSSSVAQTTPSSLKSIEEMKHHPRGWLGTILLSAYFDAVVMAIRIALLLSGSTTEIYRTFVQPAMAYAMTYAAEKAQSHVISFVINNILPPSVQEWISFVLWEIKKRIIQIVSNIIIHCLFRHDAAKTLRALAQTLQITSQTCAKTILGKQELTFELHPATPLLQNASLSILPVTFPIQMQANSASPLDHKIREGWSRLASKDWLFRETFFYSNLQLHTYLKSILFDYRFDTSKKDEKWRCQAHLQDLIERLEIPEQGKPSI